MLTPGTRYITLSVRLFASICHTLSRMQLIYLFRYQIKLELSDPRNTFVACRAFSVKGYTVLVIIKLTKFAVALRLHCGSYKLIF